MLTWRVKKLSFCSLAENLMLNMEKEARWTQEKSLLRTAANEPFGADSDFLWPGSEIPVFHWCRFQHMQGEVCFGFNNTCVDSAQLWPGERLAGLGVQRESLGTAGKGAGRKSPLSQAFGGILWERLCPHHFRSLSFVDKHKTCQMASAHPAGNFHSRSGLDQEKGDLQNEKPWSKRWQSYFPFAENRSKQEASICWESEPPECLHGLGKQHQ